METETVVPNANEDQGMTSKRRRELKRLINGCLHYQNMFEERGLFILGKEKGSGSNLTADRRFRSTFGISSRVCCRV